MEDEQQEVKYAARPDSLKHLRACRSCKLVKTLEQFQSSLCENCADEWSDQPASQLNKGVKADLIQEHTTADFEGVVAMMRPDESWVARWLRMKKTMEDGDVVTFKAGLYAIALPGEEAAAANTEGYDDEEDDEHEDEEEKGEGEGDEQDGDGVAADDL